MSTNPQSSNSAELSPAKKALSKVALGSILIGLMSCCYIIGYLYTESLHYYYSRLLTSPIWVIPVSIIAILLGWIAICQIGRNPSAVKGKATATFGIITSVIAILFTNLSLTTTIRRGSDRSKCLLQMSTMEKLSISHANMYEILPGEPLPAEVLVKEGYIPSLYNCPSGGKYTYTGLAPSQEAGSKPYTSCDHTDSKWFKPDEEHVFDPYGEGAGK